MEETEHQILSSEMESASLQLILVPLTALGIMKSDQGPNSSWKVKEGFSVVVTPHMGPDKGAGVCQMHHFSCPQPTCPSLFRLRTGKQSSGCKFEFKFCLLPLARGSHMSVRALVSSC